MFADFESSLQVKIYMDPRDNKCLYGAYICLNMRERERERESNKKMHFIPNNRCVQGSVIGTQNLTVKKFTTGISMFTDKFCHW